MRVLVAEDDPVSRTLLVSWLRRWGHDVLVCEDGAEALRRLHEAPDVQVAVVDWMMPQLDGPSLCRRVRAELGDLVYLILLTTMGDKDHVAEGLDAGADDYMTKPFHPGELQARLGVGERTVNLKRALADKVAELQHALAHVKRLQGIIPICMHCKKIRDDRRAWHEIDRYMAEHADARFSHGICSTCLDRHYPPDDA